MNKIRQILAFVRSLLDFLLNLGSHTPQKQPPHDTTELPRSPRPPFPHFRLLALASLFLLAALSLLLDMREAALAAIGAILSLSSTPRPAP